MDMFTKLEIILAKLNSSKQLRLEGEQLLKEMIEESTDSELKSVGLDKNVTLIDLD